MFLCIARTSCGVDDALPFGVAGNVKVYSIRTRRKAAPAPS